MWKLDFSEVKDGDIEEAEVEPKIEDSIIKEEDICDVEQRSDDETEPMTDAEWCTCTKEQNKNRAIIQELLKNYMDSMFLVNSDMKKRHGKYRSKLVQETIMEPVWKQYSGVDFKEAEAEAKAGNAEMQYALAWLYDWGLGVTQDLGEAFKWFTEAAFNQYAPAQTELGILYQFGILARKTDLEMFDGKERMFG